MQKPNILFIVLDTHRVDRLGCYGYERDTSPNIDAFARSATLFERAMAPAQWTIPSHASMFSGEFPSTHLTIQASSALSKEFKTLAQRLKDEGYQTVGFCNNPLVGVLENGLRRGFDHFYNYGGAIPSTPSQNGYLPPKFFTHLRDGYRKVLEHIAAPIQQAVAASPDIFQFILNPRLVSWWTRHANFKGDGPASIRDTLQYFPRKTQETAQPQFIFLNLMGTHLPYAPPDRFIQDFAPIVKENSEAGDFMRDYNTRAFHWLLPMKEPYNELESKTLSDMYDAEVAYQDHLLEGLFSELDKPEQRENTLVVVLSDHGEMLGEHNLMGHGLGLYQELIQVPMMIRFPGQKEGQRVKEPVSTTYIFHTLLEAAGVEEIELPYAAPVRVSEFSLGNNDQTQILAPTPVFSEAYPPMNLIKIIEKQEPAIAEAFPCKASHWAIFEDFYKLLRIDDLQDELYDLASDPQEMQLLTDDADRLERMGADLDECLAWAAGRASGQLDKLTANLNEEYVLERLRGLGYIE